MEDYFVVSIDFDVLDVVCMFVEYCLFGLLVIVGVGK